VKDVRHLIAHAVRVLRAGVERVAFAAGIVIAERHARLHGVGGKPVVFQPHRDDMRRASERRIGCRLVAEHQAVADVALRTIVPDLGGGGLDRILDIAGARQRLVINLDQVGGVACLRRGLGHHQRDPLADEAHLVGREHRPEGAIALRRPQHFRHEERRERAELLGGRIGAGEHAQDTGSRFCRRDIDPADAGMGMRRVHHRRVALMRQVDVVDVAGAAGDEALVLDAAHRLPDSEFEHGFPPDDDRFIRSVGLPPAVGNRSWAPWSGRTDGGTYERVLINPQPCPLSDKPDIEPTSAD
jgi:hypothetical protein